MPSLKPLNPDMPAQLADLPGELLREIVQAAIQKPEPISVTVMDAEINALLKPFAESPLLFDIAENEVMRMNTFSVSHRGWDIQVDEPGEAQEISVGLSKMSMTSTKHGLIGGRSRWIRHLQMDLQVFLQGALLRIENNPHHYRPHISEDYIQFFRYLSMLFPVLETMNVQVDTQGDEDRTPGRYYLIEPMVFLKDRLDSRFRECEEREKLMTMEYFLIMTAAACPSLPLKKKTVTFVQDPWGSGPCETLDGEAFGTFLPPDDPGSEDCAWTDLEHARAAVMFYEMLEKPEKVLCKKLLRNNEVFDYRGKLERRKDIFENGVGKTDLKMLQQILRMPKAIVKLP